MPRKSGAELHGVNVALALVAAGEHRAVGLDRPDAAGLKRPVPAVSTVQRTVSADGTGEPLVEPPLEVLAAGCWPSFPASPRCHAFHRRETVRQVGGQRGDLWPRSRSPALGVVAGEGTVDLGLVGVVQAAP